MIEYRELALYVGYRFGSDGSIWSWWRTNSRTTNTWRRLRGSPTHNGYIRFSLRIKGKLVTRTGHRLILEAFRGPCPEGMESRHLNGIQTDNRIDNLVWGTKLENGSDKTKHGRVADLFIGSKNPGSKLTESDIPEIRRLLRDGLPQKLIAEKFGVSAMIINGISLGRRWTHVAE